MVKYTLPAFISQEDRDKAVFNFSSRACRSTKAPDVPTCIRCSQNIASNGAECSRPSDRRCDACTQNNRGHCRLVPERMNGRLRRLYRIYAKYESVLQSCAGDPARDRRVKAAGIYLACAQRTFTVELHQEVQRLTRAGLYHEPQGAPKTTTDFLALILAEQRTKNALAVERNKLMGEIRDYVRMQAGEEAPEVTEEELSDREEGIVAVPVRSKKRKRVASPEVSRARSVATKKRKVRAPEPEEEEEEEEEEADDEDSSDSSERSDEDESDEGPVVAEEPAEEGVVPASPAPNTQRGTRSQAASPELGQVAPSGDGFENAPIIGESDDESMVDISRFAPAPTNAPAVEGPSAAPAPTDVPMVEDPDDVPAPTNVPVAVGTDDAPDPRNAPIGRGVVSYAYVKIHHGPDFVDGRFIDAGEVEALVRSNTGYDTLFQGNSGVVRQALVDLSRAAMAHNVSVLGQEEARSHPILNQVSQEVFDHWGGGNVQPSGEHGFLSF